MSRFLQRSMAFASGSLRSTWFSLGAVHANWADDEVFKEAILHCSNRQRRDARPGANIISSLAERRPSWHYLLGVVSNTLDRAR
jgi:hypothetical protein